MVSLAVDDKQFFQAPVFGVVKEDIQGVPGFVPGKAVKVYGSVGTFTQQPALAGGGMFLRFFVFIGCSADILRRTAGQRFPAGLFVPLVKNFSKIHLVIMLKEALWLQS
jgi:hypothetical protein